MRSNQMEFGEFACTRCRRTVNLPVDASFYKCSGCGCEECELNFSWMLPAGFDKQSLSISVPPKDRWAVTEQIFLMIAKNFGASGWYVEKKENEWVLNLLFVTEEASRKALAAIKTRLALSTNLAAQTEPLVVN
jgi:hypothetical protein